MAPRWALCSISHSDILTSFRPDLRLLLCWPWNILWSETDSSSQMMLICLIWLQLIFLIIIIISSHLIILSSHHLSSSHSSHSSSHHLSSSSHSYHLISSSSRHHFSVPMNTCHFLSWRFLFGILQSFALLLCFALQIRHKGHPLAFSRWTLSLTCWLADAARVIDSPGTFYWAFPTQTSSPIRPPPCGHRDVEGLYPGQGTGQGRWTRSD